MLNTDTDGLFSRDNKIDGTMTDGKIAIIEVQTFAGHLAVARCPA